MAGVYQNGPDPTGDLILLVGSKDKSKSIQVSSKVLSLASPVFAAMLGPRFAEGQALPATKPSSPITLTLPEDDSEAMVWFCQTIHFERQLDPELSLPLLAKLATLCDKYDASLAFLSWSEMLLSDFEDSTEASWSEFLWMSHAFGNHNSFWRVSRALMRGYTAEELEKQRPEIEKSSLPATILDAINAERETILHHLLLALETTLDTHMSTECPVKTQHISYKEACSHLTRSGHFMQELRRLGLYPLSTFTNQKSIEQISNKISEFEDITITGSQRYKTCNSGEVDIKKLLEDALRTSSESLQGLCLNCVKKGKVTTRDGNCQASSLASCDNLLQ